MTKDLFGNLFALPTFFGFSDNKNRIAIGIIRHRGLGKRDIIFFRACFNINRGKHTWQQFMFGVLKVASTGILRVLLSTSGFMAVIFPLKLFARIGIGFHDYSLVCINPGNFLLGQQEVHIYQINGLERDNRVSRLQILTGIHRADAYSPAEGCTNCLFIEDSGLLLYIGFFALKIGFGDIEGCLAYRLDGELTLSRLKVVRASSAWALNELSRATSTSALS